MLRQITPRNARSKRALDKRAPKNDENAKACLFLRGTTASQLVQDCLTDLHAMRTPLAKKFTKKNAIHPFEDAASLEFFSRKNDTSLLLFGSSSKKRRHCLTLCRTFDYGMMDMLELYVDETTFRRVGKVGDDGEEAEKKDGEKTPKKRGYPVGARPLLLFAGAPFYEGEEDAKGQQTATTETGRKFAVAKSLLTDFFRGDSASDKIDVEGLSHMVVVTADENNSESLHIRVYALSTHRSGQRLPRIEVDEIGPRIDARLGRVREPDEAQRKEAFRKPKTSTEMRTKKNIEVDPMGDKIGRVHLARQDLGELQTRKMKALKRGRATQEEEDDSDGIVSLNGDEAVSKRSRRK